MRGDGAPKGMGMTKKVVFLALILVSVLVVLNGCKSDNANDAKNDGPVLVIDQGAEPREALRYNVAHGTTTTSTMDYALARLATTEDAAALSVTPGVRLHVVSGPTLEGKRGSTRFDVRIVKAEAIVPEGTDPALKLDLDKGVAVLNNVGGWVEIDDRGIIQRSELNSSAKNPDLPARLLLMIINARTSLARVVLPAQPVGIGARWEAAKELSDEIKLNVQIQQTAPQQTVTFEEEGVELTLEALSMNATGEVILNLKALEANASASGEAASLLSVKTVEGSEKVQIDSAFDVKMTVTYEVAETIKAGKKDLEKAEATRQEAAKAAEEMKKAQE
jgi:hypothetical protein